jgi:hypothetical protein
VLCILGRSSCVGSVRTLHLVMVVRVQSVEAGSSVDASMYLDAFRVSAKVEFTGNSAARRLTLF